MPQCKCGRQTSFVDSGVRTIKNGRVQWLCWICQPVLKYKNNTAIDGVQSISLRGKKKKRRKGGRKKNRYVPLFNDPLPTEKGGE